jgi:hypothetical protein
MKRLLSIALMFGVASGFGFGLAGCGDESKVEQKETVSTPGGTTTTTKETKIDSSGQNPPANSAGQTAK